MLKNATMFCKGCEIFEHFVFELPQAYEGCFEYRYSISLFIHMTLKMCELQRWIFLTKHDVKIWKILLVQKYILQIEKQILSTLILWNFKKKYLKINIWKKADKIATTVGEIYTIFNWEYFASSVRKEQVRLLLFGCQK